MGGRAMDGLKPFDELWANGQRRTTVTKLNVNGKVREFEAEPDTPLLWVLREQLDLTGTKYGCGIAQCGACTVHIDGVPTRSCVRPVSTVGPPRRS
jgi:isoquinoline 1-oxidoreductase alpha subunit